MSSTFRVWLSLSLASVLSLPARGEKEKESEAVKVGNSLLFMVIDYAPGGPFHGHCGCPSVMIGNHDAKAIVIWSKTADAATVQLAQGANEQLGAGKKTQGYLVLFDQKDLDLEASAKQAKVKSFTFGEARLSSEQVFKRAEVSPDVSQVVLLVDDKKINAVWQFRTNELTDEMRQEILKQSAAFLK